MESHDEVVYLTKKGLREYELRLNYFINVRRSEVATRLRRALEEGGELAENAEYADAKQEQGMIEGEIERLQQLLSRAQVMEEDAQQGAPDSVRLNTRVTVREGDYEPETFLMVGRVEADPRNQKISDASPLGRALIGKKVGDKVKVDAPDGAFEYIIVAIERA